MIYPENDKSSNRIHLVLMIVMFALVFLLGYFLAEARDDPAIANQNAITSPVTAFPG